MSFFRCSSVVYSINVIFGSSNVLLSPQLYLRSIQFHKCGFSGPLTGKDKSKYAFKTSLHKPMSGVIDSICHHHLHTLHECQNTTHSASRSWNHLINPGANSSWKSFHYHEHTACVLNYQQHTHTSGQMVSTKWYPSHVCILDGTPQWRLEVCVRHDDVPQWEWACWVTGGMCSCADTHTHRYTHLDRECEYLEFYHTFTPCIYYMLHTQVQWT